MLRCYASPCSCSGSFETRQFADDLLLQAAAQLQPATCQQQTTAVLAGRSARTAMFVKSLL